MENESMMLKSFNEPKLTNKRFRVTKIYNAGEYYLYKISRFTSKEYLDYRRKQKVLQANRILKIKK